MLCFIAYFIFYFIIIIFFLHFPLSGPVLTYISLLIIPCMIVYVTNNKEPWTLILGVLTLILGGCNITNNVSFSQSIHVKAFTQQK